MATMKFKKADLLRVTEEDDPERFETVEVGDWVYTHKGEDREIIFKYEGKFYQLTEHRSGSYHTDWYYSSEDWPDELLLQEVKQVPVTSLIWRIA